MAMFMAGGLVSIKELMAFSVNDLLPCCIQSLKALKVYLLYQVVFVDYKGVLGEAIEKGAVIIGRLR
jgi:hypothetical protein